MAFREFIGHAWTDFLCENNIPFAIRPRDDLRVTTEEGQELRLDARLHWRRRGKVLTGWLGAGSQRGRHRLSFAAKDLRGTRWPRRKAHGYLEKSCFRTGFDRIRHLLRSEPLNAVAPWARIASNPR